MKTSLLLSTAALIVAGSAYAADLPAKKAAPAAADNCASAFGAGYFAIPGGDTCLKISGHVRSDNRYQANQDRGKAPYILGYKYILGFDVKSNSELGTVGGRIGFVDSTSQQNKQHTVGTPATESAYVTLGGFKAGYAPSNVDFDNAYNNSGLEYQPTGVGQLAYSLPLGSSAITLAAESTTWTDSNDGSYQASPTTASRPDIIAAISTKLGDATTLKAGLVSHEVVGSASGTAQGVAVLGRADIAFASVKLILNGAYANGAIGYLDNPTNGNNMSMGGLKDSDADASNVSTAQMGKAALEYSLGAHTVYAYAGAENGTQDSHTYKKTIYGAGFKYAVTKNLYIRPEIYQVVENKSVVAPASDVTTNYFYLRIRRDF